MYLESAAKILLFVDICKPYLNFVVENAFFFSISRKGVSLFLLF